MEVLQRVSGLLTVLVLVACGSTVSESQLQDVDDIASMVIRADGRFDIVCQDGSREVAEAQDVRDGRVCEGIDQPQPGRLICVARDDDNRNPWVFASFTDTGRVVKISEFLFSTSTSCEQSLSDGVTFDSIQMVCVARDNDNRNPWIRVGIDSLGSVVRSDTLFSTYEQCIRSFSEGRRLRSGVIISCLARDNDNRNPWIYSILSAAGEVRITGPLFSTIASCEDTLTSGRETSSSLLVCVARDNDNRNPWIIGSINEAGGYVANTDTLFSTLEQCRNTLNGRL